MAEATFTFCIRSSRTVPARSGTSLEEMEIAPG